MATAYRNKFGARCEVTGEWMEKGAGWVIPTPRGGWRPISDKVVDQEGHKRATEQQVQQSGTKGLSTGKGASECWAWVFEQNEGRAERGEKPWTDQQISEFMVSEFPNSPEGSKEPRRVRMYRSNYNRGAHSFAGMGKPKRPSREYDKDGNALESRERGVGGGITEERAREIAREEDAAIVGEVRAKLKEFTERPVIHVSFAAGKKPKKVDSAGKHRRFVDALKRVEARIPILLVGPAGCGKTHLASQLADALDLDFTFNSMSEGVSESHLLGRMLPDEKGRWSYQPSPFVKSYRDGGVHLLDEVDAADPNLLVTINAALANGFLSLPFADAKPIKRHEDSIIIAAANTFGNGADRQYVGRNQLDAATVDRFKMGTLEMDYDRDVERALVEAMLEKGPGSDLRADLMQWAWGTRDAIATAKLRRIMSTRNLLDAAKLLAVGVSFADMKVAYFTGWSDDEKVRIAGRR